MMVGSDGMTRVVKHYSTGRRSNEMMIVMPDERTAYFGDDGEYTMLFMYVADKPRDLSAGICGEIYTNKRRERRSWQFRVD
jgi:hypothetical protein